MANLVLAAVDSVLATLPDRSIEQWQHTPAAASDGTCLDVWEHLVMCLDAYADQLTQGPDIHAWLPVTLSFEADADVAGLLRAARTKATQLDIIIASSPDRTGWHPWGGVTDPSGFQATAITEIVLHGWDVINGFDSSSDWEPPTEFASVVLDRLFPHAPHYAPADAGRTLLHLTGRTPLPGLPPVDGTWRWDVSPRQ